MANSESSSGAEEGGGNAEGGLKRLTQLVRTMLTSTSAEEEQFSVRKQFWLKMVNEIFGKIEKDWLASLVSSGAIRAKTSFVELNEEHIGPYQAPTLQLVAGHSVVMLRPRGTFVIGAYGRIDMEGPRGKVVLVLDSEDETTPFDRRAFTWRIAVKTPHPQTLPLDGESFADALAQIIGP